MLVATFSVAVGERSLHNAVDQAKVNALLRLIEHDAIGNKGAARRIAEQVLTRAATSASHDEIQIILHRMIRELGDPWARITQYENSVDDCRVVISPVTWSDGSVTLKIKLYDICFEQAEVIHTTFEIYQALHVHVRGIVLVLWGDTGGIRNAGYRIADEFVDHATLGGFTLSDGTPVMQQSGETTQIGQDVAIVAVVNENTASAAEILLWALQDNGRLVATVGRPTFGKGVWQEIEHIPGVGYVRVTAGYLFRKNKQLWNYKPFVPTVRMDRYTTSEADAERVALKVLHEHYVAMFSR